VLSSYSLSQSRGEEGDRKAPQGSSTCVPARDSRCGRKKERLGDGRICCKASKWTREQKRRERAERFGERVSSNRERGGRPSGGSHQWATKRVGQRRKQQQRQGRPVSQNSSVELLNKSLGDPYLNPASPRFLSPSRSFLWQSRAVSPEAEQGMIQR
jgi:hypothetical protein